MRKTAARRRLTLLVSIAVLVPRTRRVNARSSRVASGLPGHTCLPRPRTRLSLAVGERVELVGVAEGPGVAVGGRPVQEDLLAGTDLAATDGDCSRGDAPVRDERVVRPQDLVEHRVELVVADPRAQSGLEVAMVAR